MKAKNMYVGILEEGVGGLDSLTADVGVKWVTANGFLNSQPDIQFDKN